MVVKLFFFGNFVKHIFVIFRYFNNFSQDSKTKPIKNYIPELARLIDLREALAARVSETKIFFCKNPKIKKKYCVMYFYHDAVLSRDINTVQNFHPLNDLLYGELHIILRIVKICEHSNFLIGVEIVTLRINNFNIVLISADKPDKRKT